jgi:hypothetical protein
MIAPPESSFDTISFRGLNETRRSRVYVATETTESKE